MICHTTHPVEHMYVYHQFTPGKTPEETPYPEKYYIELCTACYKKTLAQPELLKPLIEETSEQWFE
jgi:hypothetical protein